jgi:PAS domain S-box-containing protein
MRLRTQILLAVLAVVALAQVGSVMYFMDRERLAAVARLQDSIGEDAQMLQTVTQGPLYDGDVAQLDTVLDAIFANPDVLAIELKETRGSIDLRRARPPVSSLGEQIQRDITILRRGDELGRLRTTYTTANIERRLRQSRDTMLLMAAVLLAGLALAIYVLVARLTRPIGELTQAAGSIAGGDLDRRIDVATTGELAILGRSFVHMRDAVRDRVAAQAASNEQLQVQVEERRRAEAELRRSELRLREATRASGTGIFDQDHVTGAVYWSPEIRQIYGWGPDEPVALSALVDGIVPPDRERVLAAMQRALDGGADGIVDIEFRIRRPGDGVRWVATRSQTVFDGEGAARRATHTIGAALDITRRRQAEEALRLSDERLRQAVRVADIGIFDHDQIGDTIFWSPEQRAIYGVGAGDPITLQVFLDHVHPADLDRIGAAVVRAHDPAGDGLFDVEHRIFGPGGATRWIATRSRTLFEGEGPARRPTRTIGAIIDVTGRKEVEKALREGEQRFRALVELSSDWYWQTDAGHRFTFRDGDILIRMGIRPEGDYGKTRWDIGFINMGPADWADHRALLDRHEEFRHLLLARASPDGRVFWATVSGKPLFDETGAFVGYHGTGRDVTAQVMAEQALRESERRISAAYSTLNDAIESAPAAIAICDAHDGLIACNSRFKAFFPPEAPPVRPGVAFADLVRALEPAFRKAGAAEPGDDSKANSAPAPRTPAEPVELELSSGQWLQVVETRTSEGGIVTVYTDISALKRREMDLRRLNEGLEAKVAERTSELAAANRELESFASTVAHDLRAPLRGIDGLGKLLDDAAGPALDDRSRGYLQRVRASAQRMGRLIDDLLKFSQLGRGALRRHEVDLGAIARSVVEELQRSAPERSVRWSIGDGLKAWGDPGLLYQVVENLLGNAWKYSSKTADASIDFGALDSPPGMRRFFVRDNGAGFDMAHAQMLFQPFRRLHGQHEFEGTGIGLATVRRIVERHGGEIDAEAVVGKGATFVFTLTQHD